MFSYKIPETGKIFQIPASWQEITIGKFAAYEALVRKMKKEFVTIFELKDETEVKDITTMEIFVSYPMYFIKILCFWTGLTKSEALQINKNDVLTTYEYMNKLLANSVVDRKIDRFPFKGVTYLFPQSKEDINGKVALMGQESFGAMIFAFQQSANLEELGKGKFDVVANEMAILCRPEGEMYDPENDASRAKLFKDLPMDVVWQFVFFSIRRTSKFKMLTKIYTQEADAKAS